MSKPIIFLGESHQISDIKDTCELMDRTVMGIIDDDYYGNTDVIEGLPVIGSEKQADWNKLARDYDFFVTVNGLPSISRNCQKRKNFIDIIKTFDLPCANIVDPQVRISPSAVLGQGIFMGYITQVGPRCVIGDHCQIHTFCGMAHDTKLGTNVILQRACMLTSLVTLEDNAYLAPGCKVLRSNITIGANSFVHSGMLVFRDVEPGEVVKITGKKMYSTLAEITEENSGL